VSWLFDSDYVLRTSLDYAMTTEDTDDLKQTIFATSLFKEKESGTVRFFSTTPQGVADPQSVRTGFSQGIFTLGDYEFQWDGQALTSWRKISDWGAYEFFPAPVMIPPELLDRFRTQV